MNQFLIGCMGTGMLVLFLTGLVQGQADKPASGDLEHPPTALVSSKLIKVKANPPTARSVLQVPNRVDVYVRSKLKPIKVELWTGPTGTDVANAFFRVASEERRVRVGKYERFSFGITRCKEVSGILEPRVYVLDRANPYSVYEGPLECEEQTVGSGPITPSNQK